MREGFTLLELIITIAILGIVVGALVPMLGSFGQRQQLEISAVTLVGDLRQAQQFARVQRDGYKYYGLRFYGGLGENGGRTGYKIVRYEPPGLTPPFDPETQGVTVIKSSDPNDNPEFLENTFFGKRVSIDVNSEFQIGYSIVFTPEGSATSDGVNLLNNSSDEIILTLNGNTKTIIITPLTGYVRIQ